MRREPTTTRAPAGRGLPAARSRLGTGPARQGRRASYGFTLIEILIVLGIAALLVGSVLTGIGSSRQGEVVRATNQLANTVRFAFNKARVTGTYYRLLINLDKGTFTLQRGDDRMYLPAVDRYGRAVVIDPNKIKEREDRDKRAEENYNRSLQARVLEAVKGNPTGGMAAGGGTFGQPPGAPGAARPGVPGAVPGVAGQPAAGASKTGTTPTTTTTTSTSSIDKYAAQAKKVPRRKPPIFGAFEDDNSLSELKKPFSLPDEVKVVSVRTAEDPKPITSGEASLYFFPQGTTQLAHIQIADKDDPENQFTIIVRPLTGRVEVQEGKVDLAVDNDPTAVRDDLGLKQTRRSF